METKHKQKLIKYGKRKAQVDEGVADLILEIWKAGIETEMSCENHMGSGLVWLLFPSNGIEKFLNIVSGPYSEEPNSLYNRIVHRIKDDEVQNFWQYCLYITDLQVEKESLEAVSEEKRRWMKYIMMNFIILFPVDDLPHVLEHLRNYNSLGLSKKNRAA